MYGVIEKENIKIENMIYEIRGVQVIFDFDLAKLFKVETGNLNKAMKRNQSRFPSEFCFKLKAEEYYFLIFQIGISNKKGGRTKLPYVYSEQGVAMISSVLHSETAIKMSILIINAFVEMRHYLVDNKDIYKSLNNINNKLINQENKLLIHDEKIDFLFSKFDKKEQLFLKGETYDAYSNILDILNNAKSEIILIDAYADITFLDLIRNIKHNIILITRNSNRLSDIEIAKYNNQYNNLTVIRDSSFHDRYFIIDRKYVYLCGSSINNAGSKTFMIIKLEDKLIIKTLLNNINKIVKISL